MPLPGPGLSRIQPAAPRPGRGFTLPAYAQSMGLLALDLLAFSSAAAFWASGAVVEVAALLVMTLVVASVAGMYRSRLHLSVLDDLPRIARSGMVVLGFAIIAYVLTEPVRKSAPMSVAALAGLIITSVVLISVGRTVGYAVARRIRVRRVIEHRTLILGAGRVGNDLAQILDEHREYGLAPIGFIDSEPMFAAQERELPIMGTENQLSRLIVEFDVRTVVVAFGATPGHDMVEVLRACDRHRSEIFVVPRLFELSYLAGDMDSVWGIPLVRLRRAAFRTTGWKVKRAFDIVASGLALLILSPLMLACALAVLIELGPGVLFHQERMGLDGRRFRLFKFRTLRPANEHESQTLWSVAQDGRLGPVGRFLRKMSLDELPQLLNILRGEMSLVGPRPERGHFVDQFRQTFPRYFARHRVPCGLTGWAQVHGLRGDTSIEERARFDNYYIENWSFWLDVKILVRTVGLVLRGTGG